MSNVEVLSWPFDNGSLNKINNKEQFLNYPVIYILNGNKEAYIGETVYFKNRMKAHIKNPDRKNIERINLINHEQFNRSATFHLETKLINYFLGDEKYKLQNKSKTANDFTHNYYNKPFYDQEIFEELWKKLHEQKLVNNERHVIENKDIFKLSPFKELSLEQIELKDKVLEFCEKRVKEEHGEYGSLLVIEGEAGVGKSVVLSSIFNTIQARTTEQSSNLYDTENYLVVNHEEMFKTYKGIAKQVKHLKGKHFAKPTPLINQLQKAEKKADVIFVDEAHLLLTKPDTYNNFYGENQLEELLKLAKVVVIIYDQDQVLKLKSLWGAATLTELERKSAYKERYELTNQFRMQANDDVINWINHFKQKQLKQLPKDENYEFKVFEYMKDMHEEIKEKNKKHGLSRVVSTFDYLHKKDGGTYYVKESNGEYELAWNTTSAKYTWAEKPETVQEAGSIYTIQGFDLNYVGVVLGPSVQYDTAKDEIVIDTSLYMDKGAYTGMDGIENVNEAKEKIVLNSINILMKRGIKGLYIYASNEALRNKLLEYQKAGE
ncbi:DNA/RNA helicase domain-containing protein [Lysinibacillus sp. NPDC096418]|uniref:DNA/RNA helicase domain-containing protein n=1 Tax=Lysinibacillus sp. NPDC096418 TaxID=3364138 RepID=UPI0038134291